MAEKDEIIKQAITDFAAKLGKKPEDMYPGLRRTFPDLFPEGLFPEKPEATGDGD